MAFKRARSFEAAKPQSDTSVLLRKQARLAYSGLQTVWKSQASCLPRGKKPGKGCTAALLHPPAAAGSPGRSPFLGEAGESGMKRSTTPFGRYIRQRDRLLPDYNAVGSPSKTIHFLHRYLVNLVINLSQSKNNTPFRKGAQQHCKEVRHVHAGTTR